MQPRCIDDRFSRLQYPSHIAHRCGYPATPGAIGPRGRRLARAEVAAQRCGERVRLGFGRVEPAYETGEGPASAVELEAVRFQRIHRPVRQFEKDLVRLDRGQQPSGRECRSARRRCAPQSGSTPAPSPARDRSRHRRSAAPRRSAFWTRPGRRGAIAPQGRPRGRAKRRRSRRTTPRHSWWPRTT